MSKVKVRCQFHHSEIVTVVVKFSFAKTEKSGTLCRCPKKETIT